MFHRVLVLIGFITLFSACQQKHPRPQLDLSKAAGSLEIFGEGFISTSLFERDFAMAPDGKEIIFTLGNYKESRRCLVSVKKLSEGWGMKEILPFSGKYNDIEPFFSPDGTQLFFASNRPIYGDSTRTDYNIWSVSRNHDSWGDPMALDTLINTERDEFFPALSKFGTLYFTATREDGIGREDIFYSTMENGAYQKPIVLDSAINTAVYEFNAYVDPNEKMLIFSSFGRADGHGGGDLYFSIKNSSGNWSKAKNLGPSVNSPSLDFCPFVDLENNNFYFSSNRATVSEKPFTSIEDLEQEANRIENGMGNIFRISLDQLDLN